MNDRVECGGYGCALAGRHEKSDERDHCDADHDRSRHPSRDEQGSERDSGEAQRGGPRREIAVRNVGRRIRDDHSAVFQPNEGDKEPDAAGDGDFERVRNRRDDFFPDARDGEEKSS